MIRHWRVTLACLIASTSVILGADLRVNEKAIKISLAEQPAEVSLLVENSSGRSLSSQVNLELLDPLDQIRGRASLRQTLRPGTSSLAIPIELAFSELSDEERTQIPWYRLRYRIRVQSPDPIPMTEGIVALNGVTDDLFELTVTAPDRMRRGGRYHAWVRAVANASSRPVAGVQVEGQLDAAGTTRLRSAAVTNSDGYAPLDFVLPRDMDESEMELKVVASRGAYSQKAEHEVQLERTAQILVSSDKPLYQPGQTLHLRALVFDASKEAVAGREVKITILDPEHAKILAALVKTSRFGVATLDWPIPDPIRLGTYRIEVQPNGDRFADSRGYHEVSISRYDLPNFVVTTQTDRRYYLPGQDAQVEVRASYLFGQPVRRGSVRVLREVQNRWDPREPNKVLVESEGGIGVDGLFVARVNLDREHKSVGEYSAFRDIAYTAYVTDATTGRTEQRRFDIRMTREAIHVYVLDNLQGENLPLRFYVKTQYADGTPAQCEVAISTVSGKQKEPLRGLSTNRFGLARVVLPPRAAGSDRELSFAARDREGRTGNGKVHFWYRDVESVQLETDKTLYRPGEPIKLDVIAPRSNTELVVFISGPSGVLDSRAVQLSHGHTTILLPHTERFEGEVSIAAIGPDWKTKESRSYWIRHSVRTVLFPSGAGLKVDLKLARTSYRPGDEAFADVKLLASGGATEGVLGTVVFDKAVEERNRTDQDFGFRGGYRWFRGNGEEVAGFKREDLYELDFSKPFPEGVDLVAEMLLRHDGYDLVTQHGERHEKDPRKVFGALIQRQIPSSQIDAALAAYWQSDKTFPQSDSQLIAAMSRGGIELENLRDPWGRSYYPRFQSGRHEFEFSPLEDYSRYRGPVRLRHKIQARQTGYLSLFSPGPDGQPYSADDFEAARFEGTVSVKGLRESMGSPQASPSSSGLVGALKGTIKDSSDSVIPGATVKATLQFTSLIYQTQSDNWGNYLLRKLPVGFYEVRFQLPGFRDSLVESVPIYQSIETRVDTVLQVGEVTEAVTVAAGAPGIQTTATRIESVSTTTPRLREYFPETLLWQPSIETDSQGRAQIRFKLADNITTWKLAVIGSTVDGKIATAEAELRAFQPFFVDHQPPPVLTEGDEIALPVVVRNYMDASLEVKLEIRPENWFELLGPAQKQFAVPAGESSRQTFDFHAVASTPAGPQRITAASASASDAIERRISVHPDGQEVAASVSEAFTGSATLDVVIPDSIVGGSLRSEMKIYPDMLAHALDGIEGILRRPYGCAEQTISSTYPNVMVLRYFARNPEDLPAAAAKAFEYAQKGYQRLLSYRNDDGGFSYWGRGQADLALTGYALRFLHDVGQFVAVDERVVGQARDWLVAQQNADGSWLGRGWSWNDDGRRCASRTAAIARALAAVNSDNLDEKERQKTRRAVLRALDFLSRRAENSAESYSVASQALAALDAAEPERARQAIEKLRSMARQERGGVYWDQPSGTPFYGWGLAGRLETTALVVEALLRGRALFGQRQEIDRLVRGALTFLIRHKDRYGVWHSTQASVNVLAALIAADNVLAVRPGPPGAFEISVNGRDLVRPALPATRTELARPVVDLARHVGFGHNRIEIRNTAPGALANAQVVSTYYVPWLAQRDSQENAGMKLDVHFSQTSVKVGETVACRVRVQRLNSEGYGMMLAQIGLPPGADVDRLSLDQAMQESGWRFSQYDILPDRLIAYLWSDSGKIDFEFKFRPRFGLRAKTAPCELYDYYNPEARVVIAPTRFVVE